MAFTPEQQQKILAALTEKLLACSACGKQKTWNLVPEGLLSLDLMEHPAKAPTRVLPSIAFICSNCGHVQLHHAFTLGLGTILDLKPSGEEGK